jgi:hypothetical protein
MDNKRRCNVRLVWRSSEETTEAPDQPTLWSDVSVHWSFNVPEGSLELEMAASANVFSTG